MCRLPIIYKKQTYYYNHDYKFNNFMDTEVFRVLIKELRKDSCTFTINQDIEPVYILGEFAGMADRGTTFIVNDELVGGIPEYAIRGIIRYFHKYIVPYKKYKMW